MTRQPFDAAVTNGSPDGAIVEAADRRARFTPHSALDDPTTPEDAPQRESIEVRTLVFFDA